jgi:sugar phosphate isomerase/epimerase
MFWLFLAAEAFQTGKLEIDLEWQDYKNKGLLTNLYLLNILSMIETPKTYTDFQWTFSTLGCPELGLDDICKLARDFGISTMELRATENTVEVPSLFKKRFDKPEALARYLEDQQVGICSLDTSLKLVGNDEDARKAFLEFLPWADAIGADMLRVFDGGSVDDGLNDDAYKQAQETIDWWNQQKESHGYKTDIGIETHDSLVHNQSLDRILQAHPNLKIIWDTHHTWKKAKEPIETYWKHLGSNTCNVHIKDSISVPSARHPFTYVNLGDGEFPLDKTLALLKQESYTGYVSIEWERMWHPYLSDIKEALSKARELNWF